MSAPPLPRPRPAARPAPPRALAPPPAEAAAGAVPDAPHCLRGGCSPRAPAARARATPAAARAPAPASRPRPGLAPRPPFVDAGQAGAVGCAAAAPGPGSEAPGGEKAARPGPGPRASRRPAEGLRRPRPARPSRALDRSVPGRGRGSRQEGGRGPRSPPWKSGTALGAPSGPGLRGCQAVPVAALARLAPGRCPVPLPRLPGDPAGPSPLEALCHLGAPQLPRPQAPHTPPQPRPRTGLPAAATSRGRTVRWGQDCWHLHYFIGDGLPILEAPAASLESFVFNLVQSHEVFNWIERDKLFCVCLPFLEERFLSFFC